MHSTIARSRKAIENAVDKYRCKLILVKKFSRPPTENSVEKYVCSSELSAIVVEN